MGLAVGNAQDPDQNKGKTISVENLVVTSAKVDGGPMFKRIRPRARGMAFMIKRRMAHIHVKLEDVEAALAQRTTMSGLEEKAARKRD